MHRRKSLLLALYCIAISCSPPEYLSEKALAQYVSNQREFSKSIAVNDVAVKAVFWPTDLLAAQELRNVEAPSEGAIKEALAKYSDHYYFVLSFGNADREIVRAASPRSGDFKYLLETLSFRMSSHVNLTTSGQDTIPVADYVYNRTFGLSGSTDLLFAFDRTTASKQEWIQINLDEFGLGIGKQSIRFKVSHLESTPCIYRK